MINNCIYVNKDCFCGNKISEYGIANNRVDYRTLAKSFTGVLNNNVIKAVDDWELINGSDIVYYNSYGDVVDADDYDNYNYVDIFQYYIIDNNGYEILTTATDEIVYYSEQLDMYLWGVTHWGTGWDYVLTDITIVPEEDVD